VTISIEAVGETSRCNLSTLVCRKDHLSGKRYKKANEIQRGKEQKLKYNLAVVFDYNITEGHQTFRSLFRREDQQFRLARVDTMAVRSIVRDASFFERLHTVAIGWKFGHNERLRFVPDKVRPQPFFMESLLQTTLT
jgi:predicted ATP-dependent Lon-type protease|tara:strand:+ start:116 stop:526 length:411 start_codon:yes stop_codon:yes gene_type:complete